MKVAVNVRSLLGIMNVHGLLVGPPEQDTALEVVEVVMVPQTLGELQPTFGEAPFVVAHSLKTHPEAGIAVSLTDEPTRVKQPLEQSGLIDPDPATTVVRV